MSSDSSFSLDSGTADPLSGVPGFDFDSVPAQRSEFPWKVIAIVEGVIILGAALVALALWGIPRLQIGSPIPTVERYYDMMNAGEYEQASQLLDNSSTNVTGLVLPFFEQIMQQIEILTGTEVGANIQIDFEFKDMEYTLVSQTKEEAVVNATGSVRVQVMEGLVFTLPHEWNHRLTYRSSQWYIVP